MKARVTQHWLWHPCASQSGNFCSTHIVELLCSFSMFPHSMVCSQLNKQEINGICDVLYLPATSSISDGRIFCWQVVCATECRTSGLRKTIHFSNCFMPQAVVLVINTGHSFNLCSAVSSGAFTHQEDAIKSGGEGETSFFRRTWRFGWFKPTISYILKESRHANKISSFALGCNYSISCYSSEMHYTLKYIIICISKKILDI